MLIEARYLPDDQFPPERGPCLLLDGGFDERSVMRNKPNLCFISALYPATEFEAMRAFLPLIDYIPRDRQD